MGKGREGTESEGGEGREVRELVDFNCGQTMIDCSQSIGRVFVGREP